MRKFASLFTVLMLVCALAFAQTRTVTGTVRDDKGAPIPFATITEAGTNNATTADDNGNFTIKIGANSRLTISAASFEAKTLPITGNTLNLSLVKTDDKMQEVVVTTALGVRRSARSTGYSVATVPTSELTQARVTNVANGLSGKVSGLQINTVNNGVNADVRIVLRGERSILGNNQALIVIDNVPVSASYLNSLNPDDVESVSVLKGANAAALYGSDGANGVIIITSKKGVRAKPSITLTHSTTIEKVSFFPKLNTRFGAGSTETDSLSAYTGFYGHIPYENQMYGPEYNGAPVALGYKKRFYRPNGAAFDTTNQTTYDYKDPLGSFFQTGRTIQNGISYQSGDNNGSLFLSGQFNNTTGTVPKDKANRYSVSLGSSRNYNKFSASFRVGYTKFESNTAGPDYNQQRPVYWNVLNTPGEVPITNFKNLNAPFANENDWYNAYYPNPYWQLENSRIKTTQDDILGSLELGMKATSWLNFTYRIGVTARNFQEKDTRAGVTFSEYEISDPLGAQNSAFGAPNGIKPVEFDQLTQRFIIQSDFLINLEHKFVNNQLNARLLLGNGINKTSARNIQTGNNQLEIPGLYNVSNVIGIPVVSESVAKVGKIGAFGSLQLGWKNYLFLELTGRNDWVSVLAPENRSFFYPGVNASFIFTDAIKPLKNISWLSFGKLNASYTKVGNVSLGAYELSNTFSQAQGFPYGNLTGFTLNNTLANGNIKPEFIKAREVGIQLGFLRNRINLGVTYFDEDISDQTIPINISSSTGYTATNQNVGNVSNSGVEFDLKLTPLINIGPVKINFGGNLSLYHDKVDQIDPNLKSVTIGGFTTGAIYTIEGQPMRVLQVRDYVRDSLGRVVVSSTTGRPSIATNLVNVGRSTPDVILGLNSSIEYKGFTLSALAEYRGGYTVFQNIGSAMAFTGVSWITTSTGRQRFIYPNSVILVNGKYEPNTSVAVDNASNGSSFWTSSTSFRGAGTNFITSGAAWKIREMSLGWNVPVKGNITKVIKRLSLGLVARNLFTFLPKDNLYADPEFNVISATGQGTSGNAQGISNENLSPPTRIFGFTATVGF
jgi:TonB-linked SusC/RagA family outer membrane protein